MMFSTEQTFTINGDGDGSLAAVLEFALKLSGSRKIKGFYKDPKGLALCTFVYGNDIQTYPFDATIPVLVEQIKQYIMELTPDEICNLAGKEPDNDGTVRLGWEVFHPLWYGKNKLDNYDPCALIAVRPCWIVYGK